MDVGAHGENGPFENYLCDRASALEQPILGTFELNPTCNMNCDMCYVRMDIKDVNELGGLKPIEFWLDLAKTAMDEGLLFLLLTGGEPLLYPDFKELFIQLQEMGLLITMNTNGTLIDEEMAIFLAEHKIRRLNITIYGKDDKTYGELCHNPKGFTQLMKAITYLKKYNIPVRFNCSITQQNCNQLDDFYRIAEELQIPIEFSYYMFPPSRIDDRIHFQGVRMNPEKAAKVAFKINTHGKNESEIKEYCVKKLKMLDDYELPLKYKSGYICRAANSSFWVNWRGNLMPCGIMDGPEFDLGKFAFGDTWKELIEKVKKEVHLSQKCVECKKRLVCPHCAAGEISENGNYGESPEYQCEFTDLYIDLLKEGAGL